MRNLPSRGFELISSPAWRTICRFQLHHQASNVSQGWWQDEKFIVETGCFNICVVFIYVCIYIYRYIQISTHTHKLMT